METKAPLIAAIDVGTNSFHMIIASVNSRGMLQIKTRERVMVRLGSSGGDMKLIEPDAFQRGVKTLKEFADIAASEKAEIRAVATSAVREALNQAEFLDAVHKETGIEIEVISGPEECRLSYLGVIHALPVYQQKALIIDIGGGTTETIVGNKGEVIYSNSAKIGAIRLSKRFFPDGIATPDKVEECREYIKGDWTPILKRVLETGFEVVVGTAGTILNIAVMALAARNENIPEILNGITVSREDLLNVIHQIVSTKSTEKRTQIPGIDKDRADIIVAGALIVEQAIIQLNIQKLIISSYALREGTLFDTVEKKQAIQEFKNLTHLRYSTVYHLCHQYNVDLVHAEHVKKIALQLFDDLQPLHNLGNAQRELLEASSLLHDVGYHISHDQHHKHSYYIIQNCIMPGFTNDEAEIIANIARYHRKSHPKRKHENFQKLNFEKQQEVQVLSGILRIAEGIDRRQFQVVKSIKAVYDDVKIDIFLYPNSREFLPDIELWGAARRKPLLEETLERTINFKIEEFKS